MARSVFLLLRSSRFVKNEHAMIVHLIFHLFIPRGKKMCREIGTEKGFLHFVSRASLDQREKILLDNVI